MKTTEQATASATENPDREFDRVVIHVGRHKSASTYLQMVLFPQLTPYFCKSTEQITKHLGKGTFSPREFRQAILSSLHKKAKAKCLNSNDDLLIISREKLTFPRLGVQVEQYADRLKQAYPNARIICVIREQRDLLRTMYVWHLCNYFLRCSFTTYLDETPTAPRGILVRHDEVIQIYIDRFGADNVLVLPYELIKSDLAGFVKRIVDFIDPSLSYKIKKGKVNVTYKKTSVVRSIIVINHVIFACFLLPYRLLSLLGFDRKGKIYKWVEYKLKRLSRKSLSPMLDRVFANSEDLDIDQLNRGRWPEMFARINGNVERLTGIDLARYGYVTERTIDKSRN